MCQSLFMAFNDLNGISKNDLIEQNLQKLESI